MLYRMGFEKIERPKAESKIDRLRRGMEEASLLERIKKHPQKKIINNGRTYSRQENGSYTTRDGDALDTTVVASILFPTQKTEANEIKKSGGADKNDSEEQKSDDIYFIPASPPSPPLPPFGFGSGSGLL